MTHDTDDTPECMGWIPWGRPDPDDPANHDCARFAAFAVMIPGMHAHSEPHPAQLVCRYCLPATVGMAGIVGGALHDTGGLVVVQCLL